MDKFVVKPSAFDDIEAGNLNHAFVAEALHRSDIEEMKKELLHMVIMTFAETKAVELTIDAEFDNGLKTRVHIQKYPDIVSNGVQSLSDYTRYRVGMIVDSVYRTLEIDKA